MSDGDKFYTKFVVLDEIYNFVVHNVFISRCFNAKICIIRFYRVNTKGIHMFYSHKWVCSVVVGKDNYALDGETTKTKVVELEKLCNFIVALDGEMTKTKVVELES